MSNENLTEIIFVLDRSGSMANMVDDVKGGFKSFIETQKEVEGVVLVSLYQFDNEFETVYEGLKLDKVPELKLIPRGGTALLDAVGKTIGIVKERQLLMTEETQPKHTVIIVMTDGYENSSKENTFATVSESIEAQKDWEFVYLAAGLEDIKQGTSMGFRAKSSTTYTVDNTKGTYTNLSTSINNLRSGTASNVTIKDENK